MPENRSPATVVIVARVPEGTEERAFADLTASAGRVPVTWAMDSDTLGRSADVAVDGGRALVIDAAGAASRQELRRRLAALAGLGTAVDSIVFAPGVHASHRDLLVDASVAAVAVDRFDEVPRGTRRPAPAGWRCRSVVWGLWEIEMAPAAGGSLGRWLPWRGSPAPGSLLVETIDLGSEPRAARERLARVTSRHAGAGSAVRLLSLGGLARMLGQGTSASGGSVLRAA